jgi:hypothetical protein
MIPRCECLPIDGHQVSFRIDGPEMLRWNFDPSYPRPFFYPLLGPKSGESLTRMGHPGAPNHDHHQSVWFAHAKVQGIDFWSNTSPARICQQQWLVYEDADDEALMAVRLEWVDGHDPAPLLEQDLIVGLRPLDNGEYLLDLQSIFTPRSERLEFQQSNFGMLAVRVARSLSMHFGQGTLSNSAGQTGEPEIFGQPARWVDDSGPVRKSPPLRRPGEAGGETVILEGITYFDHPQNTTEGLSKWHVRADGWIGCSACFDGPRMVERTNPLVLRYLLHIHAGRIDPAAANQVLESWTALPMRKVVKSMKPYRMYEVVPV